MSDIIGSKLCDLCKKDGADTELVDRPVHKACLVGHPERSEGMLPGKITWCLACYVRLTVGQHCLWCRPAEAVVDENLPTVYKVAQLADELWMIEGPEGLGWLPPGGMPLFEEKYRAQAIADALNRAYQLGHAFGRGAGK